MGRIYYDNDAHYIGEPVSFHNTTNGCVITGTTSEPLNGYLEYHYVIEADEGKVITAVIGNKLPLHGAAATSESQFDPNTLEGDLMPLNHNFHFKYSNNISLTPVDENGVALGETRYWDTENLLHNQLSFIQVGLNHKKVYLRIRIPAIYTVRDVYNTNFVALGTKHYTGIIQNLSYIEDGKHTFEIQMSVDGEVQVLETDDYFVDRNKESTHILKYLVDGDKPINESNSYLMVNNNIVKHITNSSLGIEQQYTISTPNDKLWIDPDIVVIHIENDTTSESSTKIYHFGTKPTVNVLKASADFLATDTIPSQVTVEHSVSGTVYTDLSFARISAIPFSDPTNLIKSSECEVLRTDAATGRIEGVCHLILDSEYIRRNSSSIYIYIGSGILGLPTTRKSISVCVAVHPVCKLRASSETPSLGDTITVYNESYEYNGPICSYDWYLDDSIIPSMMMVPKSKSYEYTPIDTNEHSIKIIGYDTKNPSYSGKTEAEVTIKAESPEGFTVTYEPYDIPPGYDLTKVYENDKVKFTVNESSTPVTPAVYDWYINGTLVQSSTDKIYISDNLTSETVVKVTNGTHEETITITPIVEHVTFVDISAEPESPRYGLDEVTTRVSLSLPTNRPCNLVRDAPYYVALYIKHGSQYYHHGWANDNPWTIPVVTDVNTYTIVWFIKYIYNNLPSRIEYSNDRDITYVHPEINADFHFQDESSQTTIIRCINDTDTLGLPLTYKWYVNGDLKSNERDYTITDSSGITEFNVKLVCTYLKDYQVTKTTTVKEYYNPTTRYTLVLTNDNDKIGIFSKLNNSKCKFTGLSFEYRLGETGSGSVKLFVDADETNQYDDGCIEVGNTILIYDNNYMIYDGIITSVSQVNNFGFNPIQNTKYRLFDIEFSDYPRKLTYISPNESDYGIYTGNIVEILRLLNPSITYLPGRNPPKNYDISYDINGNNVLSHIDSICEQHGHTYRTNIIQGNGTNATHDKQNKTITCSDGFTTSKYFFSYVGDNVFFAIVTMVDKEENIFTFQYVYRKYITSESTTFLKYSCNPGANLEVSQSFYGTSSEIGIDDGVLTVNKTCYNVDNAKLQSKQYGSLSVISSKSYGKSVTVTIPLIKKINPDGSSSMFENYLTKTQDSYVISSEPGDIDSFGVPKLYYANILGKLDSGFIITYHKENGNVGELEPYSTTNPAGYKNITYYKTQVNNSIMDVTRVEIPLSGTVSTDFTRNSGKNLPGEKVYGTKYTYSGSIISGGGFLNIGATSYGSSAYTISSRNITVNPGTSAIGSIPHMVGVPIYKSSQESGSPFQLYSNKVMTVDVQPNLTESQVELIAYTLVRYNSNFTSSLSGTCIHKYWTTDKGRFPNVGERIDIKSTEEGTVKLELECKSYTINTDNMTVNFNLGMKPINVGDIIYRIKQNQMTTIN